MVYVTGDTHRQFQRIEDFCAKFECTRDDVMVILGDAGINYCGDFRDYFLKKRISDLPITLFCVHGNHEMRPESMDSYRISIFHGGFVYVEPEYPNILFAMDGQMYTFDGLRCLVIGGAYSVDKFYRIEHGLKWFEDEQPSARTKDMVEARVSNQKNDPIDVVLSHTCPLKYILTETFLPGIDQSRVDNSTEEWLDTIEENLDYRNWYCGHFHTDKAVDRMRFMFGDIDMLFPAARLWEHTTTAS